MKIAYNITYIVDSRIVDQWRYWMINEYLPAVMKTGCFESYRLHKLVGLPDSDEPTYSVQLVAQKKARLLEYQKRYEREHLKMVSKKYRDALVEFRTTMVVINEG